MKHPVSKKIGASLAALSLLGTSFTLTVAHAVPNTEPANTPVANEGGELSALGLKEIINAYPQAGDETELTLIIRTQAAQHAKILEQLNTIPSVKIRFQYEEIFSGLSLTIQAQNLAKLAQIVGIEKVEIAQVMYPQMFKVDELINGMRSNPLTNQKLEHDGRGMVIAVVDSGIDTTHKDFRLDDDAKDARKIKTITPTPTNKVAAKFTEKIPHGYDYVTGDYHMIEEYEQPHGMHIAGIIAANATDEDVANNRGIDGVAPNAQLLMYRVFSDRKDLQRAVIDDVVFHAMDDAIKHEADVISLSIGSYGTGKSYDGFYEAVRKANEKGVVVVGSMGNASTSGSTTSYDRVTNESIQNNDLATTVTIAANTDVIGVGSTTHTYKEAHKVRIGEAEYFYNHISYSNPTDKEYTFVSVGKATDDDVAKAGDLNGKVAIIERTTEAPKKQFDRLRAAGVAGVITHNTNTGRNRDYYETEAATILEANVAREIWGMAVSYNDGQAILKQIKTNPTLQLTALGYKAEPYGARTTISGFSSWGSTVDLELKPDIVAPGEGILSTFNKNQYGLMSGTSMSTPVVAGAAAVLLPEYRKLPVPAELGISKFTRIMMMNAATPLIDTTGTENSPRQQGAGLLNVQKALDNKVLVTSEDRGAVTLKEFTEGTKTFSIKLQNLGTETETFIVRPGSVNTTGFIKVTKTNGLDPNEQVNEVHSTPISGATLRAANSSITLAPGATQTVEFTLKTPGNVKNQFVEGFIYLDSRSNPNLSIPFFGFKGDWANDPIIDAPAWEANSKTKLTALMTSAPSLGAGHRYVLLGTDDDSDLENGRINPDNIAISSEGEGTLTGSAMLRLAVIRDLVDFNVDIVNQRADDAIPLMRLQTLPHLEKFRLIDLTENDYFAKAWKAPIPQLSWNGKVYDGTYYDSEKFHKHDNTDNGNANAESGNVATVKNDSFDFTPAAEGKYYFRISARNDLNKPYQYTYLPIRVDNTKPTANMVKQGDSYQITASDNHGVWIVDAQINGAKIPVTKQGNDTWVINNVPIKPLAENQLRVRVIDHAGNYVSFTNKVSASIISTDNLETYRLSKRARTKLKVSVPETITTLEVSVDEQPVEVTKEEELWLAGRPRNLSPGEHTLKIVAKNETGEVIETLTHTFIYNPDGPVVNWDNLTWQDEDDETILANQNGYALLTGTVSDDLSATSEITGYFVNTKEQTMAEKRVPIRIGADGSFTEKVYLSDFPTNITVTFSDADGKITSRAFNLIDLDLEEEVEVDRPFTVTPAKNTNFIKIENRGDNVFKLPTVPGKPDRYRSNVKVFCDDSEYFVKIDGSDFLSCEDDVVSYDLELEEKFNYVDIYGYNADKEMIFHTRKLYVVDMHFPDFDFTNVKIRPVADTDTNKLVSGTLYFPSTDIKIQGWAEDNSISWFLKMNNSIVKRAKRWIHLGDNRESFEFNATMADGDLLKMELGDFVGNREVGEEEDEEPDVTFDSDSEDATGTHSHDATPTEEPKSDTWLFFRIRIDAEKPVVNFAPATHERPGYRLPAVEATDNIGIDTVELKVNGETVQPEHELTEPGTYTVTVTALDYAGNTTEVTKLVTILGEPNAELKTPEVYKSRLNNPAAWLEPTFGTEMRILETQIEGETATVKVLLTNALGDAVEKTFTVKVVEDPVVPPVTPAEDTTTDTATVVSVANMGTVRRPVLGLPKTGLLGHVQVRPELVGAKPLEVASGAHLSTGSGINAWIVGLLFLIGGSVGLLFKKRFTK